MQLENKVTVVTAASSGIGFDGTEAWLSGSGKAVGLAGWARKDHQHLLRHDEAR
jgi:NAD(P)-dependent dehydrogenase (short-subunit alcohol dehydrogenase family)